MKFRITSKFGETDPTWHLTPHTGTDLSIPNATVLRSPTDGIIEKVVDYGKENIGKGVIMQAKDGNHLIFGHLSDNSKVHVGQHIHEGDIIALSGGSGRSSGPHLHFGMKDESGHFVDPAPYVEKVSDYAGNDFTLTPGMGVIPKLFGWSSEAIQEHAKELTIDILTGVGEALVELLASVTLVGAGLLILLKICGYRDGGRYAGVLIGVNVLLKFLGVRT